MSQQNSNVAAPIPTEAFDAEVRAFLEANAVRKSVQRAQWGQGSDAIHVIEEPDREVEARMLQVAKAFRAKLFDAGLGWISGPVAHGGRGLPAEYELHYKAIEAEYQVPDQTNMAAGLTIVGPTMATNASPEVNRKYLSGIFRGEVIACQLFSEPGAGSDLGNISTRAERDGDEWVVNGQKVWTSHAHVSDIAELFARTSKDKPRHRGITAFIIDMKSPGVEVRPIRQMTGGASFNEVFLTNVRVPDANRLCEVDDGWRVVLETLGHERAAVGLGVASPDYDPITRLKDLIIHMGRANDPVIRQRFAALYAREMALRNTNQRYVEEMQNGVNVGSKVALAKLMFAQNVTEIGEIAAAVLGPRMQADSGEWGTYAWSEYMLGAPAMHLGGGTDEIMRNILSEHVLGMPREPR